MRGKGRAGGLGGGSIRRDGELYVVKDLCTLSPYPTSPPPHLLELWYVVVVLWWWGSGE